MKSLFDRHRAAIRNVQAVVLVAALILMVILVVVTLLKAKDGQVEQYLNRVDCTAPARADASDGRYIESYKTGKFQQSVLMMDFVPTGIRICDAEGATLWEMPGKIVCNLLWSPDGRYAVVSYSTDEGGNTVVIDTSDYSEQTVPLPKQAPAGPVWLYAINWDTEGLRLCWDNGDRQALGSMYWNP